jgi:signal transduction histidine kinase
LASLGADSVTSDPHLPIALTHLRQSIDDVGDIAAGLYPRELADGLHAALRALVERSPLPVVLHAEVRRCPPEVEAAGYFVCAETLANVAKHASANHAVIRVASSEDRLVIVVADDGRGGADPARGSGLAGLVDRIESLGGELSIESPAGLGTSVRVTLPLVPP